MKNMEQILSGLTPDLQGIQVFESEHFPSIPEWGWRDHAPHAKQYFKGLWARPVDPTRIIGGHRALDIDDWMRNIRYLFSRVWAWGWEGGVDSKKYLEEIEGKICWILDQGSLDEDLAEGLSWAIPLLVWLRANPDFPGMYNMNKV